MKSEVTGAHVAVIGQGIGAGRVDGRVYAHALGPHARGVATCLIGGDGTTDGTPSIAFVPLAELLAWLRGGATPPGVPQDQLEYLQTAAGMTLDQLADYLERPPGWRPGKGVFGAVPVENRIPVDEVFGPPIERPIPPERVGVPPLTLAPLLALLGLALIAAALHAVDVARPASAWAAFVLVVVVVVWDAGTRHPWRP